MLVHLHNSLQTEL